MSPLPRPGLPDPVPQRRRVRGVRLAIADDKPTFWDRVEAGTWEPGTFAMLDRHLDARTTLVDLGAWVGPVSLYAAARGAQVVAVEADPAALEELRANIAANPGLAPHIRVVDRAIAPGAEPVRMGARRKPGDSMSSVLLAEAERSWTAPAIMPEALAALIGAADRLFIKLDIEGGEYALLPALRPLTRLAPASALLVSLHPEILEATGADAADATRAALSGFADWSCFAIEDGRAVSRDLAAALAEGRLRGDWLFRKHWPAE
jgi:FkbM family methyltransferase